MEVIPTLGRITHAKVIFCSASNDYIEDVRQHEISDRDCEFTNLLATRAWESSQTALGTYSNIETHTGREMNAPSVAPWSEDELRAKVGQVRLYLHVCLR